MNNRYRSRRVKDIKTKEESFTIFETVTVDGQEESCMRPELKFKTEEEAEEWIERNS